MVMDSQAWIIFDDKIVTKDDYFYDDANYSVL
jgi:hypothetical protein